jgi:hypothetical protein
MTIRNPTFVVLIAKPVLNGVVGLTAAKTEALCVVVDRIGKLRVGPGVVELIRCEVDAVNYIKL